MKAADKAVHSLLTKSIPTLNCEGFSNLQKLLRVTAYVLKLLKNHCDGVQKPSLKLNVDDISKAEAYWIKFAQVALEDWRKIEDSVHGSSSLILFWMRIEFGDVVPDMTAETFMRCFKRFIARRGIPHKIISDNGKTFKLANKIMSAVLSHPQTEQYLSNIRVDWVFNLERAPCGTCYTSVLTIPTPQYFNGTTVTCRDGNFGTLIGSDTLNIQLASVPSAPTITSLISTYPDRLTVTWTSVPTATSYNVFINDSVNTLVPIPSTGAPQYTFTGLTSNTVYTVSVVAINCVGSSSALASIRTAAPPHSCYSSPAIVLHCPNINISNITGTNCSHDNHTTANHKRISCYSSPAIVLHCPNINISNIKGTNCSHDNQTTANHKRIRSAMCR
eukprot:Em0005g279a